MNMLALVMLPLTGAQIVPMRRNCLRDDLHGADRDATNGRCPAWHDLCKDFGRVWMNRVRLLERPGFRQQQAEEM